MSVSRTRQLAEALWTNGKRLAIYFLAFASLGYLVIRIVPAGLLETWLGAGNP